MENCYIRLEKSSFPLDSCISLARLRKIGSCILWGAATDASADISVDTSVDTRSSIGRYPIEYRSIYRSSIDRCIDRYCYRSIYLVAHRDFTETSPILHRCFTDTLPSPSVLVDIGRYIGWYIGRHSTDTRPVDKYSSIGRYICRYIGRYIGW